MFKDIQATIQIGLGKSIEELWNGLDKDAKWGVNKAKREGLKVVLDDKANWEEFYKIYLKTIIGGGVAPKSSEELKEETNKLLLCKKGEQTIAGSAIKIHRDVVELFLNASLHDFLKFQPNNLLYWEMISWAKKNGFKMVDLGGYQINAEKESKLWYVNRFKERWGGEIVRYEIQDKNPFYILGRKIIRNFHFVKRWRDKTRLFLWQRKNKSKVPKKDYG